MRSYIKPFIVIVLCLLIIAGLSYRIDQTKTEKGIIDELAYFPSGIGLKAISLGFYGPFADFVWLRFIQYFGQHRMSDRKYEYLFHIMDILTTLDPYFTHAYTLGALMLTNDANRPDQAKTLLFKGMRLNTDEWRYPFIYGFINYYFLEKYHAALTYFRLAAGKPGAPEMTKRWAAYVTYMKIGDLKTSLELWFDLYNSTENPEEKALAEIYIRKIKMKLDLEDLNDAIDKYEEKFNRLPEDLDDLVKGNVLDSLPREPHGKQYILLQNRAESTWELELPQNR